MDGKKNSLEMLKWKEGAGVRKRKKADRRGTGPLGQVPFGNILKYLIKDISFVVNPSSGPKTKRTADEMEEETLASEENYDRMDQRRKKRRKMMTPCTKMTTKGGAKSKTGEGPV